MLLMGKTTLDFTEGRDFAAPALHSCHVGLGCPIEGIVNLLPADNFLWHQVVMLTFNRTCMPECDHTWGICSFKGEQPVEVFVKLIKQPPCLEAQLPWLVPICQLEVILGRFLWSQKLNILLLLIFSYFSFQKYRCGVIICITNGSSRRCVVIVGIGRPKDPQG